MKKHTLADAPSNCVNKIGHFAIKIVDHTHIQVPGLPGGQVTFLASPRKVTKRRRPTRTGPTGFPRFSGQIGRPRKTRPSASDKRSRRPPLHPKNRGGAEGDSERFCGRSPCFGCPPVGRAGLTWLFGPLGPPPSSAAKPGGFCEDCLSA
jgi:hypothetical protein